MVRGGRSGGDGALVAEEGERTLGTPVREVAVLAALQGQTGDELESGLSIPGMFTLRVDVKLGRISNIINPAQSQRLWVQVPVLAESFYSFCKTMPLESGQNY